MTNLPAAPATGGALSLTSILGNPIEGLTRDDTPIGSRVMNFGPETPDWARLMFASEDQPTKSADQFRDVPFNLKYWAAKAVELESPETKETYRAVRLILIDPEGETISFASVGANTSLDVIRSVYGDGPYDPPIPVLCREEKTRSGRRVWRIRPKFGG